MSYVARLAPPKFTTLNTGDWQGRHTAALVRPQNQEGPMAGMIHSWLDYADRHKARFESGIGDDYVLGPHWAAIGADLRQLLNGDCGRFDCGTLDGLILGVLKDEGFDLDDL